MMEKRSWSEALCYHVERKRERERRSSVGFVMDDEGFLSPWEQALARQAMGFK